MHDRSSAADPQAPLAAGRYRVDFALGQDGMGTVYAVTEVSTASWRSKRPRTDGGRAESTARASDQLHREYHLLAELSHPSIIRVFAYGLDDDGPFYTMELLSGHSLAQEGVLDGRRTCELARDIASSLAVIHARRLVHRDVTLGNIHNDAARGRCKLLDFGAVMSSGIPASVVGTPPYLPPQVFEQTPLDGRLRRAYLTTPGLVGRARALRQVRAFTARSDEGDRVLMVSGPAGVGRSRIVDTCAAQARASGMHVVQVTARDADTHYGLALAPRSSPRRTACRGPQQQHRDGPPRDATRRTTLCSSSIAGLFQINAVFGDGGCLGELSMGSRAGATWIESVIEPSTAVSPARNTASSTGRPATNTPLREPRSTIVTALPSRRTRACMRDRLGSLSCTSEGVARPIVSSQPGASVTTRAIARAGKDEHHAGGRRVAVRCPGAEPNPIPA